MKYESIKGNVGQKGVKAPLIRGKWVDGWVKGGGGKGRVVKCKGRNKGCIRES